MAKKTFKVKFGSEWAKNQIKDSIVSNLNVVEEKKKSLVMRSKKKSKVEGAVKDCVDRYNLGRYWGDGEGGYIEHYDIKELD